MPKSIDGPARDVRSRLLAVLAVAGRPITASESKMFGHGLDAIRIADIRAGFDGLVADGLVTSGAVVDRFRTHVVYELKGEPRAS